MIPDAIMAAIMIHTSRANLRRSTRGGFAATDAAAPEAVRGAEYPVEARWSGP
jgi:hypothetical protein